MKMYDADRNGCSRYDNNTCPKDSKFFFFFLISVEENDSKDL